MPSRKQRRRREKTFRHEYVWEDEEGNAAERLVELKPEAKKERPAKAAAGKTQGRTRGAGRRRTIEPPSWRRVGKRGAIFAPLMFVAVSVLDSTMGVAAHALQTVLLLAFFLPFSYVMDSVAYRMYLRRSGQAPPAAAKDR
jgi:hypothetical protein